MHRTQRPTFRLAFILAGLCHAGAGLAQTSAPAVVPPPPQLSSLPPAPAPVAVTPPAASAAASAARASVNPNRRVIEDDNVRVEETRVRGQLQRITVHNKTTGKDYEVIVGPGGNDPSQRRGAAGQPAWSVLSF